MEITFRAHDVDLTEPLKQYAIEKLNRLNHRGELIMHVNLILKVEKLDYLAEANLHLPGSEINATASAKQDMYAAIDALVDKLDAQVTKFHDKQKDHRRHEK